MSDVVIRPVRADDADAIDEIRRQPEVMDFTLSLPSERVEARRRRIESLGPDDHMLAAVADGRVVGIAGLHVSSGRRRHAAGLGISVHKDYHGRGIGRALMQALLDIADNYLGLVRVELEVFADNDRAIKLYESLGFQVEGRKRRDTMRPGGYVDSLLMARLREPPSTGERG